MNDSAVRISGWRQRLPMWLTMSRIGIVPLILILMRPDEVLFNAAAAALFLLASLSDYYDGYYARKYQAVSTLGKLMDPIADKILVTSILVMLIPTGRVDPVMVMLIVARDTFIGGVRAVAAAEQVIIAARPAGKWKTALQMTALPAVIINYPMTVAGIRLVTIGDSLLWASVVLSLGSGIEYYLGYARAKAHAQQQHGPSGLNAATNGNRDDVTARHYNSAGRV